VRDYKTLIKNKKTNKRAILNRTMKDENKVFTIFFKNSHHYLKIIMIIYLLCKNHTLMYVYCVYPAMSSRQKTTVTFD
jgi:hypothetical protein